MTKCDLCLITFYLMLQHNQYSKKKKKHHTHKKTQPEVNPKSSWVLQIFRPEVCPKPKQMSNRNCVLCNSYHFDSGLDPARCTPIKELYILCFLFSLHYSLSFFWVVTALLCFDSIHFISVSYLSLSPSLSSGNVISPHYYFLLSMFDEWVLVVISSWVVST